MKNLLIFLWLFFTSITEINAQKIDGLVFHTDTIAVDTTRQLDSLGVDTTHPVKKWSGSAGIGWDATSISLINPRPSEGEKLVTLGGLINVAFKYQGNRLLWQNTGSLQLVVLQTGTENWAKSIDALMWNTQLGVRMRGKWYFISLFIL